MVVESNLQVSALGVKPSLKLAHMFFNLTHQKKLDATQQASYQSCITTNQGGHT